MGPARRLRVVALGGMVVALAVASAGGFTGGWSRPRSLGHAIRDGVDKLSAVRSNFGTASIRLPESEYAGIVPKLLDRGPVRRGDRDFLVNGWRWHSRAVIRDVGRFREVALKERETLPRTSRLPACYDFLWGFSWDALLNIEGTLFYPWLRDKLPREVLPVLDDLESVRREITELGASLGMVCRSLKGELGAKDRGGKLDQVLSLATAMETKAKQVVDVQERLLVPVVAAYVPQKDQKRYNNKVISMLGILNSRVHLVSMSEALRGDRVEEEKFRKQIPSIAQAFIPRWKDKLYEPKAGCLRL